MAAAIGRATTSPLREAFHLALAGVPAHIAVAEIETFLAALPAVAEVHDRALTAHLVLPWPTTPPAFLATSRTSSSSGSGVHHVTIQLEHPGEVICAQAAATSI